MSKILKIHLVLMGLTFVFSMKTLLYLLLIYYLSMEKHFSEVKKIPDPSSYGLYKHCKYYIV